MNFIIIFKSVTYAQKAEMILNKNGVGCFMIKMSPSAVQSSCAYAVKLHQSNSTRAVELVRKYKIPIWVTCVLESNGRYKEVQI